MQYAQKAQLFEPPNKIERFIRKGGDHEFFQVAQCSQRFEALVFAMPYRCTTHIITISDWRKNTIWVAHQLEVLFWDFHSAIFSVGVPGNFPLLADCRPSSISPFSQTSHDEMSRSHFLPVRQIHLLSKPCVCLRIPDVCRNPA